MSPRDLGNQLCIKCNLLKTLKEFNKMASNKVYGRRATCKACCSEIERERRAMREKTPTIIETKRCLSCKETSHAEQFYKDITKKDVLSSYCKPCHTGNVAKRKKHRRHTDETFRNMCNLRRRTQRYGRGTLNFNMLMLVSYDTLTLRMKFQQKESNVSNGFHMDH